MPSTFTEFAAKSLKQLPYVAVLIGIVLCLIGMFLLYSSNEFTANSVEAKLKVVAVESRSAKGHALYKPIFETSGKDGGTIQFSGNVWHSPKPHEEGEIVDGRVNWTTGEMNSISLIESNAKMGNLFSVIGFFHLLFGIIFLLKKQART